MNAKPQNLLNGNRAIRVAKQLLKEVGLTISRVDERASMHNWTACLNIFKERLSPKTVFDIGIGEGTPELYSVYPNAFYFLIDPTRESLPHTRRIAQQVHAEILNLALGEEERSVEIEVRPDDIGASSLFEEVPALTGIRRYIVPMRRFDGVVGAFERPAFCKIDVQGAELQVLRGMGTRIDEIDAFLIEISTIATVRNGPEADEVIALLSDRGFVIYDILSLNRRPLDSALAQLDVLFVNRNAPMRSDRRWRLST